MSWIPLKPRSDDGKFLDELAAHEERELSGKCRISCTICSFDHIERSPEDARRKAHEHEAFHYHSVKVEAF